MCCPGAIQLCSSVSWCVLLCCVDLSALFVLLCSSVQMSCIIVSHRVSLWPGVCCCGSTVVCCGLLCVLCCGLLCYVMFGVAFCCRVVVVLCFVFCVCPGVFHCVPPRCVCTRHATVRHATFGSGQRAVGGEGMAKGNLATGN